MKEINKVAVYGTLRQGEGNHDFLASAEMLGTFDSDPEFTMYSVNGYYPALVQGGHTSIKMEVYEVDDNTLDAVNHLEGYSEDSEHNHYDRITISTPFGDAYLYVYEETPDLEVIEEGDWVEYNNLQLINR